MSNINLVPTIFPALTSTGWFRALVEQLDPIDSPDGLIGAAVDHSRFLAGFLLTPEAWVRNQDGATAVTWADAYRSIDVKELRAFFRSHGTLLCEDHPLLMPHDMQIRTLTFKPFTIVGSCEAIESSVRPSITPKLIMHDEAARVSPSLLSKHIQAYCDAFTAAHECTGGIRLVAPAADALDAIFAD
ncbi:hypothetical protein [Pseudooceanicola sp. MF1-13]|uniref:hypothetical protein n=1 Tax=Pseudooceanicola sp. MF1-13 TaxID=3379095 RepID=UPI0038921D9C